MIKNLVEVGLVGAVGYMAYKNKDKIVASIMPTPVAVRPSVAPSQKGMVWYGLDPSWANWSINADCWFKQMGYDPAWMGAPLNSAWSLPGPSSGPRTWSPSGSTCLKAVTPTSANPATKSVVLAGVSVVPYVYYHLAHGDYTSIQSGQLVNGQSDWIWADDFDKAIPPSKGKFAFLGSCGVFDIPVSTLGLKSVPKAFEKAYECVVGFTGLPSLADWTVTLEWQDLMFQGLSRGMTVAQACAWATGEAEPHAPNPVIEMMGFYKIAGNPDVKLVEGIIGA